MYWIMVIKLHVPTLLVSQGGCKPGWYQINKLCFEIVPILRPNRDQWNMARKTCFEKGAVLAEPYTKSVLTRLWSVYQRHPWNIPEDLLGPLWLGSNDLMYVDWKWSNGSPVNSALWGPGEPRSEFMCGVLANFEKNYFKSRAWCGWWLAAMRCDRLRGFICETFSGIKN